MFLPTPAELAANLDGYSITTGDALGRHYVSLVLASDSRLAANPKDHHSYRGLLFDGRVAIRENEFPIRTQTALLEIGAILAVSAQGGVRLSAPPPQGGTNESKVGHFSGNRVYGRCMLNEVRSIGGKAYVVGTRGAVYRRVDAGRWQCIDTGCYDANNFDRGFESIDGFSEDEIYAVGEQGEMWLYDGSMWRQLDSPIHSALNAVVCGPTGVVYAAGANGCIIKGRGNQWQLLSGIPRSYEFWSIACFEGHVYLTANTRTVLVLSEAGGVTPVDFRECSIPMTAYHLKVRNNEMWLFGRKDVRVFDGGVWTEVVSLAH